MPVLKATLHIFFINLLQCSVTEIVWTSSYPNFLDRYERPEYVVIYSLNDFLNCGYDI